MIPDLAGTVIAIVKLDYRLFLWTEDNREILMAGRVLVGGTGPEPVEIDVNVPDSPLPRELQGLVGSTIARLLVTDCGDLVLGLGDRQLVARAAPDHEAWQIGGFDGELLICRPGGGLAHFPPVPGIGVPRATG